MFGDRTTARDWTARVMTERQWQELVVAHAELRGWRVFHQFDSRHSAKGWPDLTLIRGAEILYVELKRQDGKVTPEQAGVLELLEVTGQEVHVWRPSDEPTVIDRLARRAPGTADAEFAAWRQRVVIGIPAGESSPMKEWLADLVNTDPDAFVIKSGLDDSPGRIAATDVIAAKLSGVWCNDSTADLGIAVTLADGREVLASVTTSVEIPAALLHAGSSPS